MPTDAMRSRSKGFGRHDSRDRPAGLYWILGNWQNRTGPLSGGLVSGSSLGGAVSPFTPDGTSRALVRLQPARGPATTRSTARGQSLEAQNCFIDLLALAAQVS